MGKIIENYNLQGQIGRGAYSTVFRAVNMKTQEEVAIKMVHAAKFQECPKLKEGTFNEVNILSTLDPHPHIIRYVDMLKTTNNYYFVYEFCNGGSLEQFLRQHGALPTPTALSFFLQVTDAFKLLNRHSIMHRDLKPENLLLHNGNLKLADFGFCKPLESEDEISRTMLGSPIYMSPELLKGEPYTIKADIWSLGVVLFRMLFGYCPFESSSIAKLILVVEQEELAFPQKPVVPLEVQTLIRRMLTKNAKNRADWNELFSYDFVDGKLQQRKTNSEPLKESLATITTDSDSLKTPAKLRSPIKMKQLVSPGKAKQEKERKEERREKKQQVQPQANQPVHGHQRHNSELRNTISTRVPLGNNFKRDLLLKSHSKLIEVLSLGISLVGEGDLVTVSLAWLLMGRIERELKSITESARKQLEMKQQDATMRSFNLLVESEVQEVRKIMGELERELDSNGVKVRELMGSQQQLMREWVHTLPKGKSHKLVLGCRVVDYMCDELVIKRETYEKMNEEKLEANMLSKLAD